MTTTHEMRTKRLAAVKLFNMSEIDLNVANERNDRAVAAYQGESATFERDAAELRSDMENELDERLRAMAKKVNDAHAELGTARHEVEKFVKQRDVARDKLIAMIGSPE